jgi:putative endonuclease
MSNKTRTLHTGFTNDIHRRVSEHKNKLVKGFTSRSTITMLGQCEEHRDPSQGVGQEKQIKGWPRKKRTALIETVIPKWKIWQRISTTNES